MVSDKPGRNYMWEPKNGRLIDGVPVASFGITITPYSRLFSDKIEK